MARTKWEYLVDELVEDYPWDDEPTVYWFNVASSFETEQEALDFYGQDGWELVSVRDGNEGNSYTFKRELDDV